ncbi:quinone oxidoreductase family protein [Pendulispora albinea]|uniref:Quinone oxidoreductase n=1 Tax=Pendulispora albinea TaxID=2741071 RepID=A0ABZ2MBT2_9BACT
MPHAIVVHEVGGPEKLSWEAASLPAPGPGEVRIRHTAIGLNFIDVYHRIGLYKVPLPTGIGQEGAGVVEAVGEGVTSIAKGDRVVYTGLMGAYAEERNAPADRLVKLPPEVTDTTAASVFLKGLTAEFLLRRTYPIRPGHTVLLHAAAGGVGSLLTPWAKALGATVIGTVSTREKAALAKAQGCDHAIVLTEENFVARVKEITSGRGVDVVYDSVGKDTLAGSLDSLVARGTLVSFGQSSGSPAPIELASIGGMRSLFITRPSLFAYIGTRAELDQSAAALFDVLKKGTVPTPKPRTFPLKDAAEAHRALESRATTGSVVLVP